MAQEVIDIGTQADDGTGDTIRISGLKLNNNFTELYATDSGSSQIHFIQNEIFTTLSNSDLVLQGSGTGRIVTPGITFNDNNIEARAVNGDLVLSPHGTGSVVIDGIGFTSGTTISAIDSSEVKMNENVLIGGGLIANGTHGTTGAAVLGSTLAVSDLATLHSLTVSGATSFVGTTTVDNLTFNDNIIATSSNADLNLTPGGTGVVNVSNITIDSSINLTDNIMKVTRSNDDFVLSANGTGSVQISKVDMNLGTVDSTVIGATTPAAGTFSTITLTPSNELTSSGLSIFDNEITATISNDTLEFRANGSGYVFVNGIRIPNADGSGNQVLQTNGSGVLDWFSSPVLFDNTDLADGTASISGASSSPQVIDTFNKTVYRSVQYHLQISDNTASRFSLVDVNVTHNTSGGFLSAYGLVTNDPDGYLPLDLTVDVSGDNIRLLGTVNNTNSQVVKMVKRLIKV